MTPGQEVKTSRPDANQGGRLDGVGVPVALRTGASEEATVQPPITRVQDYAHKKTAFKRSVRPGQNRDANPGHGFCRDGRRIDRCGFLGQARDLARGKDPVVTLRKIIDIEVTVKLKAIQIARALVSPVGVIPVVVAMIYIPWSSNSTPAWIQAIGSILAITGAAAFPYLHERAKDKANQERTLSLLREIRKHIRNDLKFTIEFLCGKSLDERERFAAESRNLCMPRVPYSPPKEPSMDFLGAMIKEIPEYVDGGHHGKWLVHRSILNDISAAHLWSDDLLRHLFYLKSAVEAGALVSSEIEKICSSSKHYGSRLQLLKRKLVEIELDVGGLGVS